MNKKRVSALFLGCALSSAVLFSGCGSVLDEINIINHSESTVTDDIDLDAPVSEADSTIRLTSHWYNDAGEKLAGATVTVTADGTELYTGVTDENGILPAFTFPSNTRVVYTVRDAGGATLGSSEAVYVVSGDYTVISMFTKSGESRTQKIQIPSGKTDIVAAMYIDSDKQIGHSNITINRNTSAEQAETVSAEDAAADGEAPAAETGAAENAAEETAATEDTAADTGTEEAAPDTGAGETAE